MKSVRMTFNKQYYKHLSLNDFRKNLPVRFVRLEAEQSRRQSAEDKAHDMP